MDYLSIVYTTFTTYLTLYKKRSMLLL